MVPIILLVQLAATVSTISLFLSGVPMVRRIVAVGDVGSVSCVPWLTQIANCLMWLKYGMLVGDPMILGVNSVGVLTAVYYVWIYAHYAKSAAFVQKLYRTAVLVFTPLVLVQFSDTYEHAVLFMGYFSSILSVLLFGSPLVHAFNVIRSGSSKSMNTMQSLASFVCAGSWAVYGVLIADGFVLFPNALGSLLGALQLVLLVAYA